MSAHRPRKRFGQHFLADPGVVDAILASIHPAASDTIVEIGPGEGALTGGLAKHAGKLHLLELDRDLVTALRHRYRDTAVEVHSGDALRFDFGALGHKLRIVGNLPYNISTPLLFHLLGYREHIRDMHFMLQKEVVDRITASPGSKAYGRLGIMLGCHLRAEALFDVPPVAFEPPPRVMSSVVRLDPLPPDHYRIDDESALSALVARAFSQRRKAIRNSLKDTADADDLAAVGIDPGARPEQIAVADFIALSNHLVAAVR